MQITEVEELGARVLTELQPLSPLNWAALKALILNSVTAAASKRAYAYAFDRFFIWYFAEPRANFSKALVQEYRVHLEGRHYSPSTIALMLSAVRKLALEAADNGLMEPHLAVGIARVRGPKRLGQRIGNWLGLDEAADFIKAPTQEGLKGVRDQAILALGIGCGLRRGEIAGLLLSDLQIRAGRWVIVDLVGKHGRIRTVPVSRWVKDLIDAWVTQSAIFSGRLFRPVNKGGRICGERISAQAVYEVVKTYACRMRMPIAPHDLRRTFAKLAYSAKAPVEQIQYSLGHGSLMTTERYLGVKQDLENAPGDRIRLPLNPAQV